MILVLTVFAVLPSFAANYRGDINGDEKVDSSDALIVLQSSVGLIKLTNAEIKIADVDKNGVVNSSDALTILQISVGIINPQIDDDVNFLIPSKKDWKNFNEFIGRDLFETCALFNRQDFDCTKASAEDYLNKAFHLGIEPVYRYLFGYVEAKDSTKEPDPKGIMNKENAEFGYYVYDTDKLKFICENVYNIEFKEINGCYYSENYFQNDKYYCNAGCGEGGFTQFEYKNPVSLGNGKYEVEIWTVVGEFNLKAYKAATATVALKNIDGKRIWSFYSVDNILYEGTESLSPTESDWESFIPFINCVIYDNPQLINKNYVFSNQNAKWFFENCFNSGYSKLYWLLFGSPEVVDSSILPDPKKKMKHHDNGFDYYVYDSDKLKYICENIYNIDFEEIDRVSSDTNYFYNGKYYCAVTEGKNIAEHFTYDYHIFDVCENMYSAKIISKSDYITTGYFIIKVKIKFVDGKRIWSVYENSIVG